MTVNISVCIGSNSDDNNDNDDHDDNDDNDVQVLDLATGDVKGVGETGELCFRGPQVVTRIQ